MTDPAHDDREALRLPEATAHLLEESRMVLPGIQALFGFQLVAVFSSGFFEQLDAFEQRLHLLSICLVVLAIAIIMTPAAYHRQRSPRFVSSHFIAMSSRLILWSMAPLSLAVCLDFYLVAEVILGGSWAPSLAAMLFLIFVGFWFVLPRARVLQRMMRLDATN
jgi:Family of unknown function (DUF6328)